jgi:hypothetical protein
MTTATNKNYSVGLEEAWAFQLGSDGYPVPGATPSIPYEGLEFVGAKTFDYTEPDAQKKVHTGNDRVLMVDYLPPTDSPSGVLTAAANNGELNAMLEGVKEVTLGEAKFVPMFTNVQGSEPDIAVVLVQKAKDAATASRRYRFQIFPKCRVKVMRGGMSENVTESKYSVAPSPTTKHLWGTALVAGTEGGTEAAGIEGETTGRLKVVAWKVSSPETDFWYPTGKPATSTSKILGTWVNGVLQTNGLTKTVTKLTFSTAPAANAIVVSAYEF